MSAQGLKVGLGFEVSKSQYHHGQPDIAYNRHANRHLVVWEQKAGAGQPTDVRGRQVHGDGSGTYGNAFNIGWFTTDSTMPAVAAIPTSPGNIKFMVVYQIFNNPGNHQIAGNFIKEDGTVLPPVYPTLSANDDTSPAVAGSEGSQEYLVAWREDVGNKDKPIKARLYSSSGDDLGAAFELGGPATDQPAIAAGYLGDFLLAWHDMPISSAFYHLFGALYGRRNYLPLVNR